MRQWLQSLTRPEDPILWAGLALVAGYALVGLWLGRRARKRTAPAGIEPPAPSPVGDPSSL